MSTWKAWTFLSFFQLISYNNLVATKQFNFPHILKIIDLYLYNIAVVVGGPQYY